MSFIKCLMGKAEQGILSENQVKTLESEWNGLFNKYKKTMGDENAAALAANKMIAGKSSALAAKKLAQIRHALAIPRVRAEIDRLVGFAPNKGLTGSVLTLGEKRGLATKDFLDQVNVRSDSLQRRYARVLSAAFDKYKPTAIGPMKKLDDFNKVVMEALGKDTGDSVAKSMAKSFRELFDTIHADYKAEGGQLGKIENYWPQKHDKALLKKTTEDEWVSFITPRLDKENMIDFKTGIPFTENELNKMLKETYQVIISDGRNLAGEAADAGKVMPLQGRDVFNRNSDSRFLKFKDADSYLEYNKAFGRGDEALFDMVIDYMNLMSREVAVMQKMGPKPNAMMRYVETLLNDKENLAPLVDRQQIMGMYNTYIGRVDGIASDHAAYAFFGSVRGLLRASKMGSAAIAALSDTTFVAMAARANGIPAVGTLKKYTSLMSPANNVDKEIAGALGFATENMLNVHTSANRFVTEEGGLYDKFRSIGKLTEGASNLVIRGSGLGAFTGFGRDAFAVETALFTGRMVQDGVVWSELPSAYRDSLSKFGMSESDWGEVLASELSVTESGGKYFNTFDFAAQVKVDKKKLIQTKRKYTLDLNQKIADAKQEIVEYKSGRAKNKKQKIENLKRQIEDYVKQKSEVPKRAEESLRKADIKRRYEISNKIDDMIQHGRNLATNEPTLRTKAITNGSMFLGDARKGTIGGEAFRSVMMFKSFPITVIINHLLPAISKIQNNRTAGSVADVALIIAGTTVIGTLVTQLRELQKGKTTRDWNDGKTWAGGFLQGGGAGLFGDFLFGDYSRFGRSPLTDSLGPVVGLANDVMRTANGNLYRYMDGKDPNFGRDVFGLVKYNLPGNNLWYSRLLMERLVFDQLEEMIDPKVGQRRRRLENKMKRDLGQEFWWTPGEIGPDL